MMILLLGAAGVHPAGIALIVGGFLIGAIGSSRVFARSRARRDLSPSLVTSLGDFGQLNAAEWRTLAAFVSGAAVLMIAGSLIAQLGV